MQFEFHEIFYFDGAENGSIENEKKKKKTGSGSKLIIILSYANHTSTMYDMFT